MNATAAKRRPLYALLHGSSRAAHTRARGVCLPSPARLLEYVLHFGGKGFHVHRVRPSEQQWPQKAMRAPRSLLGTHTDCQPPTQSVIQSVSDSEAVQRLRQRPPTSEVDCELNLTLGDQKLICQKKKGGNSGILLQARNTSPKKYSGGGEVTDADGR